MQPEKKVKEKTCNLKESPCVLRLKIVKNRKKYFYEIKWFLLLYVKVVIFNDMELIDIQSYFFIY